MDNQPSARLEASLAYSAFRRAPHRFSFRCAFNARKEATMLVTIGRTAAMLGFAAIIATAAGVQERHPLVGNWKLVSWQVIEEDGKPQDVFGATPSGYLVLTPEGRSIVL